MGKWAQVVGTALGATTGGSCGATDPTGLYGPAWLGAIPQFLFAEGRKRTWNAEQARGLRQLDRGGAG